MISGSLSELRSGSIDLVPDISLDEGGSVDDVLGTLLNLPQRVLGFVTDTVAGFGS